MILSVGVPVQRYRQVLGALFLTSETSNDIQTTMRNTRLTVLEFPAAPGHHHPGLALTLASTIALPIHRSGRRRRPGAARQGPPGEDPGSLRRGDEIGDLSGALRDMTSGLAAHGRIERFAADVAHESRTPDLAQSAVETVARVEDPNQQKKLMTIIRGMCSASTA